MPALGNSVSTGMHPVRSMSSPVISLSNEYEILASDGSATFIGDPIVAVSTASAVDGCPNVTLWAAGANLMLGAMTAVRPVLTNLTLQYRVASVLQRVYVNDDSKTVFRVKDGGAAASADAFAYATLTVGAGNTTTGISAAVLTGISATPTTSLVLKILRMQPALGNPVLNATSGTVYEVFIVRHTLQQNNSATLL